MSDHIFQRRNGKLVFVGDFDGLYLAEPDPWNQSLTDSSPSAGEMTSFYDVSRRMLLDFIATHTAGNGVMCEVGAGTGYFTSLLSERFPQREVWGCDISEVAIARATERDPKGHYFCHDIIAGPLAHKANTLILSNILWYVVHEFDRVMINALDSLSCYEGPAFLVLQNALFRNGQEYAKELIATAEDLFRAMRVAVDGRLGGNVEMHTIFRRDMTMCHDFAACGVVVRRCPGESGPT